MPLRGRVQPCVRPVDAAPMAAGPDEVRGSDPKSPQRARSAWTPRVSPIPGSTGSSSSLTSLALSLDQRNAAGRAGPRLHGRSHVGLVARLRASTVQAIRAVLLASATDTNLADSRSSSLAAQVLLALPWRASRITAVAPVTRRRRI